MLETQLPEGGVSRTNQRILANTHRILPPTLHTNNQASTADCSKTLRGLHFPMEEHWAGVALCTHLFRLAESYVFIKQSGPPGH